MKTLANRIFWGVLLILAGIFLLLARLDILRLPVSTIWVFFALVGIIFIFNFVTNVRQMWWSIIPGLFLVALSMVIGFGENLNLFGIDLTPVFIIGSLGLAFLLIFIVRQDFWWAIIPGGVMLTIAAITIIPTFASGEFTAAVLFLGLAATFGVLSLVPTPGGRMRWPLIPAGILLGVALIVTAASADLIRFAWPLALVLAGLFILFRRNR